MTSLLPGMLLAMLFAIHYFSLVHHIFGMSVQLSMSPMSVKPFSNVGNQQSWPCLEQRGVWPLLDKVPWVLSSGFSLFRLGPHQESVQDLLLAQCSGIISGSAGGIIVPVPPTGQGWNQGRPHAIQAP